jgi:hypothetical protein
MDLGFECIKNQLFNQQTYIVQVKRHQDKFYILSNHNNNVDSSQVQPKYKTWTVKQNNNNTQVILIYTISIHYWNQ